MKVLSDNVHKSIKPYHCDLCGFQIEKGSVYSVQKNVFNDNFNTFRSHLHCKELAEKLDMYSKTDGVLSTDDFRELILCEYEKEHETERSFESVLKIIKLENLRI